MRIAIVNDSVMAVEAISRVLAGTHEIAWVARTGAEAVERCAQCRPDLILMDLIMPEFDGVEATRRIMANTPCAILVVTAAMNTRPGKVFEAIGAGAVDAISTPILYGAGAEGGAAALLSKIKTIRHLLTDGNDSPREPAQPREAMVQPGRLVVFGASAGGPAALATILGALPRDFPAAVVVTQHIDEEFALSMAQWLNDQCNLPVRLAQEGEEPRAGIVLMAAAYNHLAFLGSRRLGYTSEPQSCFYRPSVDVLFESAARCWEGEIVGVLLTGMGRDGARGLKALRDAGALTIVQSRESCVVYGMPKAAVEINAADEIVSLDKIAARLSLHCA